MSSSRESLPALDSWGRSEEEWEGKRSSGNVKEPPRQNSRRNAVDLRVPKHFQTPRHVDFLLIQIASSSCSVIAHRDPPLTSGITRNAVTAVEMMADVPADASFSHSVIVLSADSPALFLYFSHLNSLKLPLFLQADSVKHKWHFGAAEYTRVTFTQSSKAISALSWLYLPLWYALTFVWLRVPNPQQLTFMPHSALAPFAATHLKVWLASEFEVTSFLQLDVILWDIPV